MKLLRVLFFLLFPAFVHAQEIAITFDDAPTGDGPLLSGAERATRLLEALTKHDVHEATFFVMTRNITNTSYERLIRYTNAGHLLGNHSHNHFWIHQVGTNGYINDMRVADSILRHYPNYQPWYRYPFLDEGRRISTRDSLREAMASLRLRNGYVTVDNYDWYLNGLLSQAVDKRQQVDTSGLRDIYIDHIYKSILFYDGIGRQHLGRSPRHILLLHENDLAALFLGDLIAHLKTHGWKIISTRKAYQDAISRDVPDVLFNGQGRVAAIARAKGVPARELVQPSEDEAYLDSLVVSRKVFK